MTWCGETATHRNAFPLPSSQEEFSWQELLNACNDKATSNLIGKGGDIGVFIRKSCITPPLLSNSSQICMTCNFVLLVHETKLSYTVQEGSTAVTNDYSNSNEPTSEQLLRQELAALTK